MSSRTRLAPRAAHRAVVLLLAAATSGLLAGCGQEVGAPADSGYPATSASPDPSSSEPSPEGTETSADPDPAADTLVDALLPAAEVPGFNEEFTWSELATEPSEPADLAGVCHKFEMTSLGAEEVAYRTYQPDSGEDPAASELVAQFPDEATAARAHEVLLSWRKDCAKTIKGFQRVDVGDLEDVSTDQGTGSWYLLIYGPAEGDPDSGYFDAQGIAMVGNRIAVLTLTAIGQDYNYPAGDEPMVTGVRAAASRL